MRQAMLAVVAFCAHAAVAAEGPENWCEAGLATTGCEVFGDTGSVCDDTGAVSVCNCTAGYTSTPPGGPCSSDTKPATTLDISVYFRFDGKDCTSARDYNANSQALRKLIEELTGGTVQGDLITTCDASKPSRGVFAEVLAAPVATLETLDFFTSAEGKIGSAAMYTPIGALGTLNRANFVTTAMQCSSSFAKKTLIYTNSSEAAICVPITCVNATFVIRPVPRVGGVEEVICGTALLPKLPPVAEKFCGSDAECAKLGDKDATCGTERVGWCKCNTPGFANRNGTGLCTDEATKDVPIDISMGFPDGNCTEYKASKPQQDAVDNMIKAITGATETGTQEVICGSVTVLTPVKVPLEKVTTDFNAAAAAEIAKPAYAAVKSQGTLEVVPIVTATPCDLAGATKTRQVSGVCQAVECDLTQAFILDASTQLCAPIETSAPTTLPPETPAPPATLGGAIGSWCASDDTCRANGDMNATCGVVDAATGLKGCTCVDANYTNTGGVLLCTSPGATVNMTLSVVFGNADCNTYNNNANLQAGVKLLMEDSTGGTVESSTVVCGSVSVISQVSGVAPGMLTKDFVTEMTSKLSATPARYGNLVASLGDVTGGSAATEQNPCELDDATVTAALDTVPGKCIALACEDSYVLTTLTDPAEMNRTTCVAPATDAPPVPTGKIENWCITNATCRAYGDEGATCEEVGEVMGCVCTPGSDYSNTGDVLLCTSAGQKVQMLLSLEFGNAECSKYANDANVQNGVKQLKTDSSEGNVDSSTHICGSVSVYSKVSSVPVSALNKNFVTDMRNKLAANPGQYGNINTALGAITGGSASTEQTPCELDNAVATAVNGNVPDTGCVAVVCAAGYHVTTHPDASQKGRTICTVNVDDDDDDLTRGELAAAIAVPIIVVLLLGIGVAFFCLHKGKEPAEAGEVSRTAPDATPAEAKPDDEV